MWIEYPIDIKCGFDRHQQAWTTIELKYPDDSYTESQKQVFVENLQAVLNAILNHSRKCDAQDVGTSINDTIHDIPIYKVDQYSYDKADEAQKQEWALKNMEMALTHFSRFAEKSQNEWRLVDEGFLDTNLHGPLLEYKIELETEYKKPELIEMAKNIGLGISSNLKKGEIAESIVRHADRYGLLEFE